MPIGMKQMPRTKNAGSTVRGVRIGCHALSRCWRNAEPAGVSSRGGRVERRVG